MHSPHDHEMIKANSENGQASAIKYLNFNRKITALASGNLSPKSDAGPPVDALFVGTQSNLLSYDVERNADFFYTEVQDGVNALIVGKMGRNSQPMVIAGGNCSILGFDGKGNETFWTVTADNVSSLALCDVHANKIPMLLVGSDDLIEAMLPWSE